MEKQKFFNLTWDWYEEGCHWTFYHPHKTNEEFESDVNYLFKKYGKEYLDQETSWAGAADWTRFIVDKMPELGYEPIKPYNYGHFGSYIISYEEDRELPEEDVEFKNIIGDDLFNRARLMNQVLNKECMEGLDEETKKMSGLPSDSPTDTEV